MSNRNNFSKPQRESALRENARWLQSHRVDGICIALPFEDLQRTGVIYYCENCMSPRDGGWLLRSATLI